MPATDAVEHPIRITATRLILVEGPDDRLFLKGAIDVWDLPGIQVLDYGGVPKLRPYLRTIRGVEGFDGVASLIVQRDADTDADAAWRSATDALMAAGLPSPKEPFVFAEGRPRTAVMVFPGHGVLPSQPGVLATGTLEDLCPATVAEDRLLGCADEFLDCAAKRAGEQLPHPKKSRLHAYLAGKDDRAGLKLGEATKAGAWNLDHPALTQFRQVITEM